MFCNGQGKKGKKSICYAMDKEKRLKKYHETVAQMMQRGRFLQGAANFTRACASLQCARIPETLTIKSRHDYIGILPQSENFLSLSEYCILFTSICMILSAGKKYGGEGVRGGGCGVVFSSTSCQGHQAIWSWAKFTLNYRHTGEKNPAHPCPLAPSLGP